MNVLPGIQIDEKQPSFIRSNPHGIYLFVIAASCYAVLH